MKLIDKFLLSCICTFIVLGIYFSSSLWFDVFSVFCVCVFFGIYFQIKKILKQSKEAVDSPSIVNENWQKKIIEVADENVAFDIFAFTWITNYYLTFAFIFFVVKLFTDFALIFIVICTTFLAIEMIVYKRVNNCENLLNIKKGILNNISFTKDGEKENTDANEFFEKIDDNSIIQMLEELKLWN